MSCWPQKNMKFLSYPSNNSTEENHGPNRGPGVQCRGRDGSIGSTPGVVAGKPGIFRSKSLEKSMENPWDCPVSVEF